jgi:hypothetical protein
MTREQRKALIASVLAPQLWQALQRLEDRPSELDDWRHTPIHIKRSWEFLAWATIDVLEETTTSAKYFDRAADFAAQRARTLFQLVKKFDDTA